MEQLINTGKLKTAWLGLNVRAAGLLESACATGLYEVVSIADGNLANANRAAQVYNCTAFDDYRQFILQNQPDVLIVAEPLTKCAEFVKMAINKKCHILKLIPTAPNFELASEFITLAKKNNVKYVTAAPVRFSPGFERLGDYLRSVERRDFYFVNMCATFGDDFFQPIISYPKAEQKLSGGGALLNDCFELLSLLVENFSLPNQVYALLTNQSPDKKAKQYFGEDTVTASLVFKEGLIGTFMAARQTGNNNVAPVRIYGSKQNIIATPNRLAIYDENDNLFSENKYPLKADKCITEMFIDFGRALLEPDKYKLRNSSRLDLATMALIEAAYLSTKTGMPESPGRFFEISEKERFPFV
ncbi:MAG: Gfo/Idh/MocA family oxidoreductase [Planctomycetaceae bacterium]|nr:Gfo/Idh/MocA family oxidoreductase [Planctomycetaceae bacterium]